MRRSFPSCSGSAPTSIRARRSATRAMPARPTAKSHAIAASFPSSRPRRTRRTGPPSSPGRFIGGVPVSSRPSASSSASSASPYAARRQSETSLPSSLSSQALSWPNPSTRPRPVGARSVGRHEHSSREATRYRSCIFRRGLLPFAFFSVGQRNYRAKSDAGVGVRIRRLRTANSGVFSWFLSHAGARRCAPGSVWPWACPGFFALDRCYRDRLFRNW